jgi:phosphoribosylformylglycinamidine synthase
MKKPNALIFGGLGINCEKEMAHACTVAGANSSIIPIQAFLNGMITLDDYQLLCFPGGFSFADELGAGKVLANRLVYAHSGLKEKLVQFVENGNAILGICNGFQLLVKMGLLPGDPGNQSVSLAHNDSSRFENRWVHHSVQPNHSIFLKGLTSMYLPIRHGEGKLIGEYDTHFIPLKYATEMGNATQTYPANPNGSAHAAAGLVDKTGRILGMMAHPEAALYFTQDPRWQAEKELRMRRGDPIPTHGDGYALFYNAINYFVERQ